ncbi:MAG TPA: hypothetical protein VKG63_13655 [Steroidobacteraceae bacterium]|nr:hypothetical protein [Steroidobacteraceae bacterium]
MVRRLLIFLVAAHCAAASGTTPDSAASRPNPRTAAGKYQTWRTAAAAALIARADANSLATAAALRFASPTNGPSALDLAARASELAPQSASIGWMRLQLCLRTPACDVRDAATVMRWVDADNGAAWLQALGVAQKDPTEVDRILADMAHGTRFDFYWNRIVVLMADALHAVRNQVPGSYPSSDASRLKLVSGIASAELIPPFSALVEACRESGSAQERRELCLKLSKIMQRGDTVVAQMVGFSIERRLHAPDSKEARAIAERRRVLEWRVAAAAKFDDALLPWTKNARARARLMQMRAMPREEDVCIAILREHKMALDPPEIHP